MYKRLTIFTVIIILSLSGLAWLGHHAIQVWIQGIEGVRIQEFAEVAEQIHGDVTRKLDDFIQSEQDRDFTEYFYYYFPDQAVPGQSAQALARAVPQSSVQTMQQLPATLFRSPLAAQKKQGLAFHHFQVRPDGAFLSPHTDPDAAPQKGEAFLEKVIKHDLRFLRRPGHQKSGPPLAMQSQKRMPVQQEDVSSAWTMPDGFNTKNMAIQSFGNQQQKVLKQSRQLLNSNFIQNNIGSNNDLDAQVDPAGQQGGDMDSQTVEIKVTPFKPHMVRRPMGPPSMFGGPVYMLRSVIIDEEKWHQGFLLDEQELISEIQDSADRFIRKGMGMALQKTRHDDMAYTGILNFGFGHVVLQLLELDPDGMNRKTRTLTTWFFGIVGVGAVAVLLGLAGLWSNARSQLALSRKKDDFISAVSHELRTPLTSIRMYSEMLEKHWVPTEAKREEAYSSIRQESERLTRLIENVLDFSRMQRGRKTYAFQPNDLNTCLKPVIQTLEPCAEQQGFTLETRWGELPVFSFDRDAVAQIVINLVDNAMKYARDAEDKTIVVTTRLDDGFAVLSVKDFGPGIPAGQRKKIFQPFYRIGDEATRETKGTGLGLALVKRFAEAHQGFVAIEPGKPAGTVVQVGLAV